MIKTAFASSIGRVRETNQDFVKVFKNQNNIIMGIVCDGMGGHQGGDVASTMAVSHLGHNFEKTDFTDPDLAQKWLTVQLRLENETILNTADRFSDLNVGPGGLRPDSQGDRRAVRRRCGPGYHRPVRRQHERQELRGAAEQAGCGRRSDRRRIPEGGRLRRHRQRSFQGLIRFFTKRSKLLCLRDPFFSALWTALAGPPARLRATQSPPPASPIWTT